MKGLYSQFKTDSETEKNGIWVPVALTEDHKQVMFKLARAGGSNQKYLKVLEARTKPLRRLIANETLDVKLADEVMMEVFADAVVLGWENVTDEEGNPLPFSRENVIKVFKDLPDLFNDVREQATKAALYRKDVLEAEAKNS